MIIQIFKEAELYKPLNFIKFALNVFFWINIIIKDKTILTLPFKFSLNINWIYWEKEVFNYYEIPFYKYDYSNIVNPIQNWSLLIDIWSHFWEVSFRYIKNTWWNSIIFEPNPRNQQIIKDLFKREWITNYRIFEIWLWDVENTFELNLNNPLSYEWSLVLDKNTLTKN